MITTLLLAVSWLFGAANAVAHGAGNHFHSSGVPSVLILANSPTEPAKLAKLKQLAEFRGFVADTQFISGKDPDELGAKLLEYDVVILDYVYRGQFDALISAYEPYLKQHEGVVFAGMYFYRPDIVGRLTPKQSKKLYDYYSNGGEKNFSNFFQYIKRDLLDLGGGPPESPIILPETGIYHPDSETVFTSLDEFYAWKKPSPGQSVVGIGFMRKSLEEELMTHVDTLVRRLEANGIVAAPYFHPTDKSIKTVMYLNNSRYLNNRQGNSEQQKKNHYGAEKPTLGQGTKPSYENSKKYDSVSRDDLDGITSASTKVKVNVDDTMKLGVDLLVTYRGVMNSPSLRHRELEVMDVVVIDAMVDGTQTYKEWLEDDQGWPMFRMGPWWTNAELAGYIDPTVVGIKGEDDAPAIMPEQMDALVERIENYLTLRNKNNAEKKIAFLVWNSPDGEDNFAASYLNVPSSLIDVFNAMRQAGYSIDDIDEETLITLLKKTIKPYYRTKDDIALRQLLKENLAEKLPIEDYKNWYDTLHISIRQQMQESWPDLTENYLTIEENGKKYYVIPRIQLGNIQLLPQPLRGARRDLESDIMHDKKHPVHHAYRAVYHHLTEQSEVDAIVHFGTHGTQEWLGGKECGQWVKDDTQTTIGNVPLVYPYNVANSGEGLIAKRRGRAVVVSHNAPPFAPAGLYGDLVKIHEIMHQLENMEQGRVYENTQKQLVKTVKASGFDKDLELTDEQIWQDWQGFIDALHAYMEGIASAAQPLGMHIFGSVAKDEHVLLTILQILGPEYLALADVELGVHVLSRPYEELMKGQAYGKLKAFVLDGTPLDYFSESIHGFLLNGKKHWDNFQSEKEIEHLLKALEVKFIPTGTGNDPLRNPESVPTGKNTYAFDPSKIPTKAAWEAGKELAKSLIDNYVEQHGVYPDKLTFSMWSTETIKHFGVIEAEIFYLLGVEPIWNRRDQVVDVKVIPATELGRPRIDTVLSLTGLYRDNLPEVMNRLQSAINKVAALKEKNNYVYQHTQQLETALKSKGLTEKEAEQYARVRLFGSQSGVYGTHLPEATMASDTWEGEESLAELYLARMGYMFGNEDLTRNAKLEVADLFAENLKGTDAAILSRSTNNHGILSLDHPFEYLGGISLAVRHLDGQSPELFIADLRNTRNFANETVPKFLAKELRSRYYHPRWISEMKDEGYSGATEMLDMVNNFWGWNVMDRSAVREDQWQELYEIYVDDKLDMQLDEFFEEHHPAALAQISERMLEAVRKEYWDAPDETVKDLVETYMDMVSKYDIDTKNETFKEYVAERAKGFGIAVASYKSVQNAKAFKTATEQASTQETVQGKVLKKQETSKPKEEPLKWWLSLLIVIFVLGFIYEYWMNTRNKYGASH